MKKLVGACATEQRLEEHVVTQKSGDRADGSKKYDVTYGLETATPAQEYHESGPQYQRDQKHQRAYGIFFMIVIQSALREKARHRPV